MTRLPLEILLMIFEKIDLINLIKLRSTCKYWKSIIDNNKIIKELTIAENCLALKNNKTIYLDQFKLDGSKIFKKIIGSNIIHNLKYLNYSFNCYWPNKNKLIPLNCFKLLEHLVLVIDLIEEYVKLILVHPNLKILSVSANPDYVDYDSFKMEINCPKCENLIIDCTQIRNYDIIYPERIKILKIGICDLYSDEIAKFTNIEQLEIEIHCFEHNEEISPKISKFVELKKLTIRWNFKILADHLCFCSNCIIVQLYKLINHVLISKKQIQFFLNDEAMNSKKQYENYIDKVIGSSDFSNYCERELFKNRI